MGDQNGGAADGIAFVFQTVSTSAIGMGGFGMGYYGIQKSGLAVEFDVYLDVQDSTFVTSPDIQHVSVHPIDNATEGSSLGRAILQYSITDGLIHQVVIQQQNGYFLVYLDNMVNPIINIKLNVSDFINSTSAFIGFTGSTGPFMKQDQSVYRWIFDYISTPPPSVSVCYSQVSVLHEVSLPSGPPLVPISLPQPQPQNELPQFQPQLQEPQPQLELPQPQLQEPQPQLELPQPQLQEPQPQLELPQPHEPGCGGNTPEGTNFQCINNVWQSENLTLLQVTKLTGIFTVQGNVIVTQALVVNGSMNIQHDLVINMKAQMQIEPDSTIVVSGNLLLGTDSSLYATTSSQLTIKGCAYFNNSTFNLTVDPVSTSFQMNYSCKSGIFGLVSISQPQCTMSVNYQLSALFMDIVCNQRDDIGQLTLGDVLIPLVCGVIGITIVGGSVALLYRSRKYRKELNRVRGLSKKIQKEVNVVTTTIPSEL